MAAGGGGGGPTAGGGGGAGAGVGRVWFEPDVVRRGLLRPAFDSRRLASCFRGDTRPDTVELFSVSMFTCPVLMQQISLEVFSAVRWHILPLLKFFLHYL